MWDEEIQYFLGYDSESRHWKVEIVEGRSVTTYIFTTQGDAEEFIDKHQFQEWDVTLMDGLDEE